MVEHDLTREQMLRTVGMLEVGLRQTAIAGIIGTTQSIISGLYVRDRETGDMAERHEEPRLKKTLD